MGLPVGPIPLHLLIQGPVLRFQGLNAPVLATHHDLSKMRFFREPPADRAAIDAQFVGRQANISLGKTSEHR